MSSQKVLMVANWKMHKTPQEGLTFARQLKTKALNLPNVNFILCPSATGLLHIHGEIRESALELGAQNLHYAKQGAYTGEISASMLNACGCKWVIIGHSERRHIFNEPAGDRQQKVPAALNAGLRVILCIGEVKAERDAGDTAEVLGTQLANDLGGISQFPTDQLVIAYEPVWAIGSGLVAMPAQVEEAHAVVRETIFRLFPDISSKHVSVIYGGSINTANAAQLIGTPGVDGFLIGGASLNIGDFVTIAQYAQTALKVEH